MSNPPWPVIAGSFQIGDPNAPVAVCTLTSDQLYGRLAKLPGVAISGMVYTANLGIERIIQNITTNPSIRFLLLCGKDSQLFKPGQSLVALAENGVNSERRIVGASGYEPVLQSIGPEQIAQFRKQVELIDWTGEQDIPTIRMEIGTLAARNPGTFKPERGQDTPTSKEEFVPIRPGGQLELLVYDPKGYFVISIDREQGEIMLRHYLTDHKPAHIMRGRGATSMLLGLIRDGLVTQLSHAGYLGEELAKAQTALQFGLRYDQDRPLRPKDESRPDNLQAQTTTVETGPSVSPESERPKMPPISPAMTLKEFDSTSPGSNMNVALTVIGTPEQQLLQGILVEPDEAEPFNLFHRTSRQLTVAWSTSSKIIMGAADEVMTGALLRVMGKLAENGQVQAEAIVILTKYARIK